MGSIEYPVIKNTGEEFADKFNSKLLLAIEKFEQSLPDVGEVGLDEYLEIRKLKIKELWQQLRDETIQLIFERIEEQAYKFINESLSPNSMKSIK